MSGNFLAHMSAESPLNISPTLSEVISEASEPLDNFLKYPTLGQLLKIPPLSARTNLITLCQVAQVASFRPDSAFMPKFPLAVMAKFTRHSLEKSPLQSCSLLLYLTAA
jgi:hypothetical protein